MNRRSPFSFTVERDKSVIFDTANVNMEVFLSLTFVVIFIALVVYAARTNAGDGPGSTGKRRPVVPRAVILAMAQRGVFDLYDRYDNGVDRDERWADDLSTAGCDRIRVLAPSLGTALTTNQFIIEKSARLIDKHEEQLKKVSDGLDEILSACLDVEKEIFEFQPTHLITEHRSLCLRRNRGRNFPSRKSQNDKGELRLDDWVA